MIPLTIIVAVILAPIVVVTAFFALELLAGLPRLRSSPTNTRSPSAVVVIPAHDEEAVIGRILADINAYPVLVVADNCVDRTAAVAKAAGAEVVMRHDLERRGKGFALAAAREQMRAAPPEVVIVVDADCRIDASSLRALAKCAAHNQRACQAVNLLAPDLAGPALVQISTFAFMIKNLVRQRGLAKLTGRAHLTGTGMALPWRIFESADLGGSNIVEDLTLGLELAERSEPPTLVESATVWSSPESAAGTLVQRRRWEGGYLATALRAAPGGLAGGIRSRDRKALLAALDLCVPPLALLFVLNGVAFVLALAAVMVGASAWPLFVQLLVGLVATASLVAAWAREGRRFVTGATLLRLPMYVLWKLPMYLGFVRGGAPKDWLRTGRN